MKFNDLLKECGIRWICEYCNYDIADIRSYINGQCEEATISPQSASSSLSRIMKKFKEYINKKVRIFAETRRMEELLSKLRHNNINL